MINVLFHFSARADPAHKPRLSQRVCHPFLKKSRLIARLVQYPVMLATQRHDPVIAGLESHAVGLVRHPQKMVTFRWPRRATDHASNTPDELQVSFTADSARLCPARGFPGHSCVSVPSIIRATSHDSRRRRVSWPLTADFDLTSWRASSILRTIFLCLRQKFQLFNAPIIFSPFRRRRRLSMVNTLFPRAQAAAI